MTTDTSEKGLEALICTVLTGHSCDPTGTSGSIEPQPGHGGVGWAGGSDLDYNRGHCVDLVQLSTFLNATQPEEAASLSLDQDSPTRRQFLARLEGEVSRRGIVDVLRKGIEHGPLRLELFYGTPSPRNEQARERFEQNRFTVTRQLHYSLDEKQRALDIVLFINGLPVITFELKNNLTKQTMDDAIRQYKKDRNPREKLFKLGRCVAHFAVDEAEASFCTHLKGEASWFLPFNRGWNDGAGNPPNPDGIKTDYLWREVLARKSLTNILENYTQLTKTQNERTGGSEHIQVWPRYHQLDVVRKLLADAAENGVEQRYLIQHSAGSGKSNSIAWLAHQLIGLAKDGEPVFNSIIVITDRTVLDRQIAATIRQHTQVKATVGHAKNSGDLKKFIETGQKIIISTVQKFPQILKEIGNEHRGSSFAIIIDEAHSGQGGSNTGTLNEVLTANERGKTFEDKINHAMKSRKLLSNASYFAFTATPKNKTLEIFGQPDPQPDGSVKHHAFHNYTMKQAIQERFILDVLTHYTPVSSYYRLAKTIEDDPEFDTKRANKKLRRYVEGHDHAIRLKAEIMVDHFHDQVLAPKKIGGEARAMVVTSGVSNAIRYFHAIRDYLEERKSPYRAIVAFSGEREFNGITVSEASLNDFPSSQITDKIREDPHRFLICADKFQTGYDEPLLHTMYVDKVLSDIRAVQTLSRLNRADPKKHDVFVLDFKNKIETIRDAFANFYRTTVLADKTDPNKLHDLQADLDHAEVYSSDQVENFSRLLIGDVDRDDLDPILDACAAVYLHELNEDEQVDFKGKAKSFVRTYNFLSCVLPYTNDAWEMRSILLSFLIPKLPAPKEDDLSKGILDAIDMDSYRAEKQAVREIILPDEDGEIEPGPIGGGGHGLDSEKDRLSNIIRQFNDLFGGIKWKNADRVKQLITETIPECVAADTAYRNAHRNSDRENARIEHNKALKRVVNAMMSDDTQLFQQFSDNKDFKRWMTNAVFDLASERMNAG